MLYTARRCRDGVGALVGSADQQMNCDFEGFQLAGLEALSVGESCSTDEWTVGYSPEAAVDVSSVMRYVSTLPFSGSDSIGAGQVTPYSDEDELVTALNRLESGCRVGIVFTEYPGDAAGSTAYAYQLRFDAVPGGYDSSESGSSYSRKSWETSKAFPTFLGQGPRGIKEEGGSSDACQKIAPPFGWGNSTFAELAAYCSGNALPINQTMACFGCAVAVIEMDVGTDDPGYIEHEYITWESLINRAIASQLLLADPDLSTATLQQMTDVQYQRFPYPEYTKDGFLYAIQFGLPLLLMLS